MTVGGGRLTLRIEDAGARLNLNALVPTGVPEAEARPSEEAEEFLVAFIDKILDELVLKTEQRLYDSREMARNLLDYMDADDVAIGGRDENEYYLRQDPPYTAANRPLLSVEEIALVEGFDVQIAEAMRPYVTVHPLLGDQGINVNTAPPHVLALLYQGPSGDRQLSDEDTVRDILQIRDQDKIVCTATQTVPDLCVGLAEAGLGNGSIYPETTLPMDSSVFLIHSEAQVDDVVRTVEAVIDVTEREEPRLLSWRSL
jgi:general secretion pathway protein K